MKNWMVVFSMVLLVSCKQQPKQVLNNITGDLNDVLVVMEKETWQNPTGQKLKEILVTPYMGLPQDEPSFKVFQVSPMDFKDIFKIYRNIIEVRINTKLDSVKMGALNDVYSKPQSYVLVEGPSSIKILEFIELHQTQILNFFHNAEVKRLQESYKKTVSAEIVNHMQKNFGIKITVPANFKLDIQKKDFTWMSFESPKMSQGILVYRYAYTDTAQFNLEHLVIMRDSILKMYVPGPAKGSYMTTEKEFPTHFEPSVVNNEYSVWLNGLWKVQGDFMGGPFVSYSFLDCSKANIICIEGFVYNPKEDKRDYMMQLEAIIKTKQ
jgi:hypothetical protein